MIGSFFFVFYLDNVLHVKGILGVQNITCFISFTKKLYKST